MDEHESSWELFYLINDFLSETATDNVVVKGQIKGFRCRKGLVDAYIRSQGITSKGTTEETTSKEEETAIAASEETAIAVLDETAAPEVTVTAASQGTGAYDEATLKRICGWKASISECLTNPPKKWQPKDIEWLESRQHKVSFMIAALQLMNNDTSEEDIFLGEKPYEFIQDSEENEFGSLLVEIMGTEVLEVWSELYHEVDGSRKDLCTAIKRNVDKVMNVDDREMYVYFPEQANAIIKHHDAEKACYCFFYDTKNDVLLAMEFYIINHFAWKLDKLARGEVDSEIEDQDKLEDEDLRGW